MAQPKQTEKIPFSIHLGGKLITATDPLISTLGDFQSLVNLRYTDRYPEAVLGMTKENNPAFDYPTVKNGFYFRKDKTLEQHTFAQVFSGTSSKIKKSNNTTSVPTPDTYSDFLTLSSNTAYFTACPDESMMIMDGNANYIWSGNEYRCAAFIVYDDASATFRYDYTIPVSNTINDAQDRATMHVDGSGKCTVLLGSVRPLSGAKFYVGTANTNAATVNVKQWLGTAWSSCTNIVDGTVLVAGKTLSQTGTISFDSTVTTAKVSVDHRNVLYYYKFIFSGLNPATTVYYCTVQCPPQPIVDIWDGEPREISECWYYDGTTRWNAFTSNVLKIDYVDGEPITYGQLGTFNNLCGVMYCGFSDPQMGVDILIPDGTHSNGSAGYNSQCTLSVNYWNGVAWTSVGTIVDGTSIAGGTQTMAQSGTVTWNPPDINTEFKTAVESENQFYYYQFVFSYSAGSVFGSRLDYITGIPAQVKLLPYRFALLWNNTLWLCNDQVEYKNALLGFAPKTCSVANGTQVYTDNIGDDEELVAGTTLFSRFGSSIYDNMILFKRSATYLMDGNTTDTYRPYCISAEVGCVAPLTVQTCDTSYEVAPNLTKHIVIWQSDRGIESFDGNAISLISEDIDDFFNKPSSNNYINKSLVGTFSSFYDQEQMEYHWITDSREMVYNLEYKKWFEIKRGEGKSLLCGFSVSDPSGNKYTYGGTAGYLERLENGTDFDGNDIVYDIWTVDSPMSIKGTIEYMYRLRNIKIVGLAQNNENIPITFTVYADTNINGEVIDTFSQANSTSRIFAYRQSLNVIGYVHSFRLQGSSNATQIGLQILNFDGLYDLVRADSY